MVNEYISTVALRSDLPSNINLVIWWLFPRFLSISRQLEERWLFEQGFHTAGTVKLLFLFFLCLMSVSKSIGPRDPNQRHLSNWDRAWGETTRWVILLFTVWKFAHLTIGLTARAIKGPRLKFRTLLSQPEKLEIWFTQDSPVQQFFSVLSPSAIAKDSHLVISNAMISIQCVSKT